MKVYISLDMEGIPGTFNWEHESVDRAAVRACMHKHLGDIVDGLFHSHKDIREIVIADSHSGGDNIGYDFTERDERITLISGTPRSQYMMPALNEDYDRVFLVGYHAGTGSIFGSMDHTYANKRIHKIWINDQPMNEAIINAAYAGYKKVPVTLVSGDWALQQELMADNALPWAEYIATKRAISKFAAILPSDLAIRKETMHAVAQTMKKERTEYPLLTFKAPITLRIEFIATSMADIASYMPHTRRINGRTIEYTDDDYGVIFDAIMALVTLASTAQI